MIGPRSDGRWEAVLLHLDMTWNRRYRVASYLRLSLWVLEQVHAAIVELFDARLGWVGASFGRGEVGRLNASKPFLRNQQYQPIQNYASRKSEHV